MSLKELAAVTETREARRKHLLARMAGNVAAGLTWRVAEPSHALYTDGEAQLVADAAVDIAERILKRIGL